MSSPYPRPERPDDLLENGTDIALPFTFNIPVLGTQISLSRSVVNGGGIVLGGIILAALVTGVLWWRRQIEPTGDVFKLYQRMLHLASWMGAAIRPWQTPYEHAAQLQRRLPARQEEIVLITDEYVQQTFGPSTQSVSAEVSSPLYKGSIAWRRLHPEMVKAVFKRYLPGWLKLD